MILYNKSLKILAKKKFFLFDFDGTICDNDFIHETAFLAALENFDIQFSYSEVKGMKTVDAFVELFDANNISYDDVCLNKLVLEKQKTASKLLKQSPKLMDGFLEFHKMTANKKKCIVSSGSETNIRNVLKYFDMENDFSFILHSKSVINSKPNPEGLNLALKYFKCDKNNALVFEDSIAGFKAAKNADIDCVDINTLNWKKLIECFTHEEVN